MEKKSLWNELVILIIASLILAIAYVYPDIDSIKFFLIIFIGFLLAITINIVVKKIVAYRLEADVTLNIWSLYRFGFAEKRHFKKSLPMLWLPLVLSYISRGEIVWMPILESEITPRPERIAKRHELFRFSQMTEWHISLIIFAGIISNLILYIILNSFGLNQIGVISLYFALWSLIPFSKLDGSKLFFGSRKLGIVSTILSLIALIWQSGVF